VNNQQVQESEERGRLSFFFFTLWTFFLIGRPEDYFAFLVPLRPVFWITIITLLVMFLQRINFPKNILQMREVRLILLFYIIMIIGIPFAVHRRVAFDFVFIGFLEVLLYFFTILILVQSTKRLNYIVWIAVLSVLFSSFFYLTRGAMSGGIRVSGSLMYDPNDFAMIFSIYLPLCIYTLLSGKKFTKKIVSITAIFTLVIGIIMSESRGGILALAVVLCAMLFLRTSQWKGGLKIITIIIVCAIGFYFFPRIETRFEGISNDYNWTDPSGRMHIWMQNLDLLYEHPILGVGANCSAIALGFYRMAQRDVVLAWQVSHSSILQVAVETGIPGFLLFLILNVGAIYTLRKIRKTKNRDLSLISFFLELSFYGFWASGIFLSHGYSSNLYFLLAISATIRRFHQNSVLAYEKNTITELNMTFDKQLQEAK
jgi:O-antigen ligase